MKTIVTVCLLSSAFFCGSALPAAKKTSPNVELSGQVFIVTRGQQTFKLALVPVFAVPEAIISKAIASRAADRSAVRRTLIPQIHEKKLRMARRPGAEGDEDERRRNAAVQLSGQVADFGRNCQALGGMAFVNCMNSPAMAELKSRADAAREAQKPYFERSQAAYHEYRDLVIEYKNQRDAFKFFDGIESDIAAASTIVKTDAEGNFNIETQRGKRIAIFARAKRQVMGNVENYLWLVWVTPTNANKIMLSNDNLIDSQCSECIDFRKGIEWDKEIGENPQ